MRCLVFLMISGDYSEASRGESVMRRMCERK